MNAISSGSNTFPSPTHGRGKGRKTIAARLVGMTPWAMIALLLYAGLFIKPKPVGNAVVPPTIERRDLLFGTTVTGGGGTVWLAGNFGKLLKSTDGGKSWTPQVAGVDAHLQDISAWNANRAVAVGNGATVLRTENGGVSWTKVPVEHSDVANKLIRVRTSAGGEAWAVGEMGAILYSADYGASWRVMRKPEDVIINDIDASNPRNIWAVGEYGRMFHSRDSGATWEDVKSDSRSSLSAIEFRDADNALAVGLDGAMLATSDGGATWRKLPESASGNRQHLFAVKWDESYGEWLAVGSKGAWVRADASLTKFATGKLSPSDLAAHTKIGRVEDGSLIIAGDSPGVWDRKQWTSLIGR